MLYAIHSRWLGPNHVNATASEAMVMSTNDGEKKAWNWERYVAQHLKYLIILRNFMEYGYQGLDPGLKVRYLLNGIRCEKLSTAVVTFLTQYMDKRAPTLSVNIASVGQTRPAKRQKNRATYGLSKIEFKKYSREEYSLMSTAQCQQL